MWCKSWHFRSFWSLLESWKIQTNGLRGKVKKIISPVKEQSTYKSNEICESESLSPEVVPIALHDVVLECSARQHLPQSHSQQLHRVQNQSEVKLKQKFMFWERRWSSYVLALSVERLVDRGPPWSSHVALGWVNLTQSRKRAENLLINF